MAAAPIVQPLDSVLLAMAVSGPIAAVIAFAAQPQDQDVATRLRAALRWALMSALVVPAVATYLVALGVFGFVLICAVVAGSPPALRWFAIRRAARRRVEGRPALDARSDARPSGPGAPEPPTTTAAPDADLAAMSTPHIVTAWRRTFWELNECRSWRVRHDIVRRRAAYLDELERRDSGAVQGWLHDSPRAADIPSKYFRGQGPPSSLAS